jgi:hypothetical protein
MPCQFLQVRAQSEGLESKEDTVRRRDEFLARDKFLSRHFSKTHFFLS